MSALKVATYYLIYMAFTVMAIRLLTLILRELGFFKFFDWLLELFNKEK